MQSAQSAALLINGDPYTVRACLKNGIRPVSVNSPNLRDWDFVEFPAEVEVLLTDDPSNLEGVLATLQRHGLTEQPFVCVWSSDEMALTLAAALGKVLAIPAMDPAVAVRFRDKWLQKKLVGAAGVNAAASRLIEDIHHLDGIGEFETAVLKPVAGGGTRNTSVVHGRDELVARCAEYRERGVPQRMFVLEDFVAGDEWTIDGVVFHGQIQFFSVSTYAVPCLSTLASSATLGVGTEVFDPTDDADVYALAGPMAAAALRALGFDRGVFHMEAFYQADTGRLVFGECAGRPGGGLTQEIVECKFGVDLSEAALLCAAGTDPQVKPSVRSGPVGFTTLANRSGTVVRYPTAAEVRQRPGVEYARLERPYGFQVNPLVDTTQGMGQVMFTASTRAEFRDRRDSFVRWFEEQTLIVPAKATVRELRAWQATHFPDSTSRFATYSR